MQLTDHGEQRITLGLVLCGSLLGEVAAGAELIRAALRVSEEELQAAGDFLGFLQLDRVAVVGSREPKI